MPNSTPIEVDGLKILGNISPEYSEILSPEAINFLAELVKEFGPRVKELLQARNAYQADINSGNLPDFLPDTKAIREGDWKIKNIPEDLQDRRVEITGPTDRKMVINALNANVKVFMADCEDSLSPTWNNIIQGQINLRDAVNHTIEFTNPGNGKQYKLNDKTAVLICRARGLHLPEKHITFNDEPVPGSLIDFGLYFFHNHKQLLANGTGPYFYIPKLQSYLEARWWNDVFTFAESKFELDVGTIKATYLIETLPAAFQMNEILFELKDHIVALNCGRWDYIFSYIKTLKNHPNRVLPDRQAINMNKPFLNAYSRLLIQTCHKRGAMAMGGMAAFIPSKDPTANEKAMEKVNADKELEASNGHDGTWVAHPGLADIACGVFDKYIGEGNKNQLKVSRSDDPPITAEDLLAVPDGDRTEEGMRINIRIAVQYIEAWISGNGCVPIYNLMEDAATAEISRASIWQWIKHDKELSNGKLVTKELFRNMLQEELDIVRSEIGENRFNNGRFTEAAKLFDEITTADELVDFLTLPAYDHLN